MLTKEELVELNTDMCCITYFDIDNGRMKMKKDRIGYNIVDYYIMRNLLFIPTNQLTDKELYSIAVTLYAYKNTQVGHKVELKETIKHYEDLLGITEDEIKNERTKYKDRNKKYIPDKYKHLFKQDPEIHYINYDPVRDEVILDFDSDTKKIRSLKHELEAKWIPVETDDEVKFYLKIKCDYLPKLLEEMKNASKSKHFVPDLKLCNFISKMNIDLDNANEKYEQIRHAEKINEELKEIDTEEAELIKRLEELRKQKEELKINF